MESTPRTPWSRKRKQQAKVQKMLDAKHAKVHTSPLPSTSTAPTEATSSGTAGQLSETHSQSLQDTAEVQDQTEETLDESFRVPIATQPSDDSSDESSSDEFSSDDARQKYDEWLKEQPKDNIKMMAVMFADTLISRFNMTACGAANKVGLVLNYNEKTVRKWLRDFYNNQGTFTESKQGKHSRLFILDDEGLRHKAAEWVRANATVKGKPNMTGSKFCAWVNSDLLPNAELQPGCQQQIQPRTAIKWLHHLGFRPQSHK